MVKQKEIDGDIFHYINERALSDTLSGVLEDKWYEFESDNPEPFIIDGGGHYGVSLIYFLKKYPKAHVLVFEPDPNNIEVIKKTIESRNYENVELVESALSDKIGKTTLYGELLGDNPDSLGNSTIKSWGDRGFTTETEVSTVLLSDYIDNPVDFLKLNIEGAEKQVLRNLFDTGKISEIKEMCIHYHQTKSDKLESFSNILDKIKEFNFNVSYEEIDLGKYLPKKLDEWSSKSKPRMFILKCSRKN